MGEYFSSFRVNGSYISESGNMPKTVYGKFKFSAKSGPVAIRGFKSNSERYELAIRKKLEETNIEETNILQYNGINPNNDFSIEVDSLSISRPAPRRPEDVDPHYKNNYTFIGVIDITKK